MKFHFSALQLGDFWETVDSPSVSFQRLHLWVLLKSTTLYRDVFTPLFILSLKPRCFHFVGTLDDVVSTAAKLSFTCFLYYNRAVPCSVPN